MVLLLAQQIHGAIERVDGVGLGILQTVDRALRRFQQGLGIGQPAVFGVQRVPFIKARRQLVQLANLPADSFAFTLQVVLRRQGVGKGLGAGSPLVPECCQLVGVDLGIGVEQVTHRVGPGQALPGVLSMDVDQLLADFAHLRGSGRAAIDPAAAFSLQVNRAAHQQGFIAIESRRFKPG